jgi:Cft2 family RNA processing exonuclease
MHSEIHTHTNRCYLVTHAHLDHVLSLILLSGSLPRPISTPPQPNLRTPVYATKETLSRLSLAYKGDLWPELAIWDETEPVIVETSRKRRRTDKVRKVVQGRAHPDVTGCGVVFCPYVLVWGSSLTTE